MIQAIETRYNGYHFRSRLEARWAVFFDELGVRYEYEKEGYDLGDLGWYLPDFWLPELHAWFEIKPLSEKPEVPKVYCAGRIGYHNSDWRTTYGAVVARSVEEKVIETSLYGYRKYGGIDYIGPHLIDPDSPGHVVGFGAAINDGKARRKLLDTCLQQIKESDVVMAILYDDESYGTLVELGYAKALGKTVWIAVGPFINEKEHWFALEIADKVIYADSAHRAMAEMFPWPPPEIAKAAMLLKEEGARVAFVAYGDPLDDTVHYCGPGTKGQWYTLMGSFVRMSVVNRDTKPFTLSPSYANRVQLAAAAARAARFEHGRKGTR